MPNTTISDPTPSLAYGRHSARRVIDPPLGYVGRHRATARADRQSVPA